MIDEASRKVGRQVEGAFTPLKLWLEQKKVSVEAEVNGHYSAEAASARWDASLAKSNAIWWPNGWLQP